MALEVIYTYKIGWQLVGEIIKHALFYPKKALLLSVPEEKLKFPKAANSISEAGTSRELLRR